MSTTPATTQEGAKILVKRIDEHLQAFEMQDWWYYDDAEAAQKLEDGFVISLENIDSPNTYCGTTLCAAGFATMEAGYTQKFVKRDWYDELLWLSPKGEELDYDPDFHTIGKEFLHLTEHQATALFVGNTDNDVAYGRLVRLSNGESADKVLGFGVTGQMGACTCIQCD